MSRIVQAVNAMISKKDKISNVRGGLIPYSYFFTYNYKYVWSIEKEVDDDDYLNISNYPLRKGYKPEEYTDYLSGIDPSDFRQIDYVCYSTRELNTREAIESFRELYTIVKEKILGIDITLDDIIENSDVPF